MDFTVELGGWACLNLISQTLGGIGTGATGVSTPIVHVRHFLTYFTPPDARLRLAKSCYSHGTMLTTESTDIRMEFLLVWMSQKPGRCPRLD